MSSTKAPRSRTSALVAGLAAVSVLSAACGLFTKSEMDVERDRLDEARALWQSRRPAAYRYEFQRICFCPRDLTDPAVITVRGGSVVSVTYAATGAAVDPSRFSLFPPVEGLFDVVENAIDEDFEELVVQYDPTFGYPTRISGDASSQVADDEATLTASELMPLP